MADSWEDLDDDAPIVVMPDGPAAAGASVGNPPGDNEDEDWDVAPPPPTASTASSSRDDPKPSVTKAPAAPSPAADDRPLLLLDFTVLSDGALHNKFDKASCNDPDLKREWTRKVEADYEKYSSDTELLSSGVVKPCGASVWRDALATLRDQNPGHFWAPVFPPPKR